MQLLWKAVLSLPEWNGKNHTFVSTDSWLKLTSYFIQSKVYLYIPVIAFSEY